jgi:hypothetical protein
LGKTSGGRVIRALPPPDYISAKTAAKSGCDFVRRNIAIMNSFGEKL